mmetsp:Transcript_31842/g.36208  ORF Transcript_31842/g.36208 Transcript_31842/m.36208 type:complete len:246 (-) Transcript_31842:520-1257(-)|eukprot:CAMPEP_0115005858 /NCGR_PEP_ID=MMETSP0216-20121206/20136_1 /TAXON_ID=223996 /ORGANISM="Protocruzia adherens, Strain Boccale" /LENGTH=245 /DNA_ID=CAMNT_0002372293 /DNA_START=260 /DNA_END=997 /DNA_ORIENTATION=-
MNPSFNPSMGQPTQQVPNYTGVGTRKFLGQSPLIRCCCCFDISLNTGCKVIATYQLIVGFVGILSFLSVLGNLNFNGLILYLYWMSYFTSGWFGLKACSSLKAEYARKFYYYSLYRFLIALVLALLALLATCSNSERELECQAWKGILITYACGEGLFDLYFLWVIFSFYTRLDMGQMELVLYGPAYQHLAARNAAVAAQSQVSNPQLVQGVQLHAVQFPVQGNSYSQVQDRSQDQFQNQQHNQS